MNTLLTTPLSPQEKKALGDSKRLLDKAQAIALGIWLEGYKAGDISLERMAKGVYRALITIKLPEGTRKHLLGDMVDQALSMSPPVRTRGGGKIHPISLKKTAVSLVDLIATKEGLSKSRYSPKISAYEKASQILNDCGFAVSANTLINWYSEFRK
ncbi:hypothetical protein C2759_02635 [Polynucleobacter sp. MG-Unter2-18]|uniref:hypothetical protein n=1 Tax=Polynucleobacter sp. MG-Unter2-18 TaxID=2081052 RepID=UPI001BFECAC2|nr:hypothetical protein [Polynucleobacter sp. MG-Unter2-18]QWD95053.1 hypothetical protein C2759_02635 [Polynucleobacter sp. MG-Unter2-18]